jgi:hypothetical protein
MKQFKMFGIITSVLIIGLLGIITIGCDNPSGGGKDDSVM